MTIAAPAAPARGALRELLDEARVVGRLAASVAISTSAQQSMALTDVVFVGHLGEAELAAAGLGTTLFNLAFYVVLGAASSLDTLGSAAHGRGDAAAVRGWAVLAAAMITIACAPCAALLCAAAPIARAALGQDARTAAAIGGFCRGLLWGLWPAGLSLIHI